MDAIKLIHVVTVALSISGFIVRGIWMIRESDLLRQKWVRILPHINDTALLVSAIILVSSYAIPVSSPWLLAKILALLLYIALGFLAFRLIKIKLYKIIAFLAAVIVFLYIVLVALSKSPFPFI